MKTLIASLIGLGILTGTANAQYVTFAKPGYAVSPEICAPGVIHSYLHAPKVVAAAPEKMEAPAEAEPEAPADAPAEAPAEQPAAPQLQAPLPPK